MIVKIDKELINPEWVFVDRPSYSSHNAYINVYIRSHNAESILPSSISIINGDLSIISNDLLIADAHIQHHIFEVTDCIHINPDLCGRIIDAIARSID